MSILRLPDLKVLGLKLYLNKTTGNFLIDKSSILPSIRLFLQKPILVHAEDEMLDETESSEYLSAAKKFLKTAKSSQN